VFIELLTVYSGSAIRIESDHLTVNSDVFFYPNTYLYLLPDGQLSVNGKINLAESVSLIPVAPNATTENWVPLISNGTSGSTFNIVNDTQRNICYTVNYDSEYMVGMISCGENNLIVENVIHSELAWLVLVFIFFVVIYLCYYLYLDGKFPFCAPDPGPENIDDNPTVRKTIPEPPFKVVALADYMAVDSVQMSVKKGNKYTVIKTDEGKFWFQSKPDNGKPGWFPASYVRLED
jgi:hypothetical protein